MIEFLLAASTIQILRCIWAVWVYLRDKRIIKGQEMSESQRKELLDQTVIQLNMLDYVFLALAILNFITYYIAYL